MTAYLLDVFLKSSGFHTLKFILLHIVKCEERNNQGVLGGNKAGRSRPDKPGSRACLHCIPQLLPQGHCQ